MSLLIACLEVMPVTFFEISCINKMPITDEFLNLPVINLPKISNCCQNKANALNSFVYLDGEKRLIQTPGLSN